MIANAPARRGLNANQLKLIAIVAMTVDHLARTLFPGYSRELPILLLHVIGRLTAPIMWFFVAEGFHHTRNRKKYALRLFVLAVISHFAYCFCFGKSFLPFKTGFIDQTGVAWSLAWGLVLLCINDAKRLRDWQKTLITLLICVLTFPSDWSCVASLAVLFIGANRGSFKKQMIWMMGFSAMYAAVYFICLDPLYGILQLATCLSIPLLKRYNGERGAWKGMGKLFYIYYPAHLALCGVIRVLI